MTRKRPGLGKGLAALIPNVGDINTQTPSGVQEIPINLINPNPRQPRSHFDPESLADLASSIKEHGIIQPLIVTHDEQMGEYSIIAGERRLQAAKLAFLNTVPAIVREASDQDRLELALIENVQRDDLSPIEAAKAYQQLNVDFSLSHAEIATKIGKSRAAVTNTLRLLNLPPSVQQAIIDQKISEGHARALLGLPTSQSQSAALATVYDKGLNVRQTEILVRKLIGEKPLPKSAPVQSPEIKVLEERLQSALGTKVRLKHSAKGGTMTIHYYSNEELDSLARKFMDSDE
ncbi:MAG: ParB/RepB/Spo0J family partition protein [Chloroflexi bacterium]|nr:ParB/RepB/Spo0J family partition protein [Chloroflexota bacterium]